ncbi:hypothetical protein [Streptomyces platensis]|uniref:hypothetical protein n=1 Tax=Streptomyces platensis TaxID=58346 RepID=UPI003796A029
MTGPRSTDGSPGGPRPVEGPTTARHFEGGGDALSGGRHAFVAAVRWVLVAVAVRVAAGLVYALWRLVRGRLPATRRRRAAGGHTPQPADGPADAPGAAGPFEASDTAAEGDREPR